MRLASTCCLAIRAVAWPCRRMAHDELRNTEARCAAAGQDCSSSFTIELGPADSPGCARLDRRTVMEWATKPAGLLARNQRCHHRKAMRTALALKPVAAGAQRSAGQGIGAAHRALNHLPKLRTVSTQPSPSTANRSRIGAS